MRDLRDFIKPAVSLLVICFVTAFLLAMVNGVTKGTIEARTLSDAEEQRKQVMTEAESFKELKDWRDKDETGLISGAWAAYKGGKLSGYVFSAAPKGYGGAVAVTVGITTELKVTGVKLGENKETPGLGTKAADDSFIGQYAGKTADKPFKVVKGKTSSDGNEINAISGATITSKAVTSAVQASADLAGKLLKNGGALE